MWLVKKDLPEPLGPKYELVAVGRDAFLHGQVGYVYVQRATAHPVRHLDAERGKRTLVVGFLHEQAESPAPRTCRKLSLRRKVGFVAGYARPKERGHVPVLWRGLHSIRASWLPTSLRMRLISSRSSLHAMTLQWQRTETSPLLCARSGTRLSIPCLLGWHGSSGRATACSGRSAQSFSGSRRGRL